MQGLEGILYGFSVALTPHNLMVAFMGAVMGTLVGVLPGLGPSGAMALLLPVSFHMDPTAALILLAGIYYGAMYGGSTTSILLNMPGESASVATCIEGYRMARRGRGGAALAMAAVGSFVAGTLGIVVLMVAAPPLAEVALSFGPPEFMTLAAVGLAALIPIMGASLLKGGFMALLGVALATVGMEQMTGVSRFTFGTIQLMQGIDLVPLAMGVFGITEMLVVAETATSVPQVIKTGFRDLFPRSDEWRRGIPAILRGSVIGVPIGMLPGPSATLAAFTAFAFEKRISGPKSEFGHGAIEGVAGPESANNAASSSSFVPMLALGIPFAPITALLLGAITMHGVQPGPLLIDQHPELFWGVIASMYIGNGVLLVLNLPLVGVWASILRLPLHLLTPIIAMFALLGTYTVNSSVFDLMVLLTMGAVGYLFRKLGYDLAPLVLGFVLGPMMETAFRQSMIMMQGDFGLVVQRPLVVALVTVGTLPYTLPWGFKLSRRLLRSPRDSKK